VLGAKGNAAGNLLHYVAGADYAKQRLKVSFALGFATSAFETPNYTVTSFLPILV
jgi:hypothetical protein